MNWLNPIATRAQAQAEAQAAPHSHYSIEFVLSPYVGVFMLAFMIAFIATPIMRKIALASGIVDWPDLKRKQHLEPVAYLGGLAVFMGWIAGVSVSFFIHPHCSKMAAITFPMSIIFGALLITVVGFFDDVYSISPRVKIGGQLLAAAALASQQVGTNLAKGIILFICDKFQVNPVDVIPNFGHATHYYDPTYWLGALLVAFLVLSACNAANLLDGLDGLASGVTAIVALGLTAISVYLAAGYFHEGSQYYSLLYDPVRLVTCLALLGAVLGFLPYNFNPATIFMGDTGSMLLGYLCISTILLFAAEDSPNPELAKRAPLLVMAGLTVFALPLIDTAIAIVRRKSRGQPIFSADNQHIHHQLIHSGLSVKQSVISLYLMALGFAGLGFAMIYMRTRFVAAVFMVVVCFVAVTTWKVAHRQYLRNLLIEKGKLDAQGNPIIDSSEPSSEASDSDESAVKTAEPSVSVQSSALPDGEPASD